MHTIVHIVHFRAYISFDKLLRREAGKSIAENHPKNNRLQKAVKEMEFVSSMAQRLVNDRLRENGFDFGHSSVTESEVEKIGQREPNHESVAFNQDLIVCHIRTRSQSQNQSISNNFAVDVVGTISQPISIKSKIAKVGRNESTIEQPKRMESESETLNRTQSRSQIHTKANGADKPAVRRMKTRSQSLKKN